MSEVRSGAGCGESDPSRGAARLENSVRRGRPRTTGALLAGGRCAAGIAIILALAGCGQRSPWSTGTSPNDAAKAKAQFKIATARYQINHSAPEARAGLLEAARTDPTYAKPYYNLAVLAAGEGDWKEAARLLGEYRKRDETSDTSVRAQLLMDRYEKIAGQISPPSAGKPNGQEYEQILAAAQAVLKTGNARGAMTALNAALRLDSARWEALALKAAMLTEAGWFKDAQALYKLAMANAPADRTGALKAGLQESGLWAGAPRPARQGATGGGSQALRDGLSRVRTGLEVAAAG